jgi:hypothetical protein
MKYLAILKDSLREALDSKLLYFTLGLSALVVLVVGSVTFRSVPVEELVSRIAITMNWVMGWAGQGQAPRYSVTDFEQTNDASEPWLGEYRFVYVQEFPDEDVLKRAKDSGIFQTPGGIEQQFQQGFHWAKKVTVTDKTADNSLEFRYQVETQGSKLKDRREWVHEPALFFGLVPMPIFQGPLADLVDVVADKIIGTFGAAVTMLLSVIITASFIPTMLHKGTIDLLLAKPIRRPWLLIYKFIGGLSFMFLNTVVVMAGLWFVLGLQTHVWINGLLLCIFLFTFQFAIFYAVSTLMGVLTRNTIVAILTSMVVWVLLFAVGWGYRIVDSSRPEKLKDNPVEQASQLPGWLYPTADVIHFVLPHYKDLDALTTKLINRDLVDTDSERIKEINERLRSIKWAESLGATTAFIAIMVGLACWRFSVKDY